MKVCFVHQLPHPSHRGFAEAINATFCHYHTKFCKLPIPRTVKSILEGLTLPKADIYLCEGGAPLFPVWIKKKFNRKAINIELVGDETFMVLENTSFVYKTVIKVAMSEIDGAIAVSKLAEESIKKYLEIPTAIVYPYIEDELYKKLVFVNPNLKNYNIVSVGYAKPAKGMDLLVKAFEIVKREFKDAELFIVGRGHPKEWEKVDGVHVLGYVDDLAGVFKKCSLFVQPSRFDAFAVSTLEALRAGLPSIVTEMTGAREVVENLGKYFVRKVEAEDIATGILKYFDLSEEEKFRLSEKARKLSEPFNKNEMCERFKKEFWKIVEAV
uniref:Glycosyltransferase n=1 Tax=candidate division WOR-3 bacterium TaxID=2052148 RepID=A0A7V3ZYB3_UNCW3